MTEVQLEIPPRLDYLAVVRLVVAAAAVIDPPLPESRLDDLRLAVTEACSNAIKAHRSEAVEPVVIRCHLDEDRFRIHIRDRGHGFDPDSLVALPDPEDPARLQHESGLGVPLIRVLTDDVSFVANADGTTVSMTLKRPGPTSPT